ncbi:MBL fold metallo-hydrolase [Labrys miyagiensis]|uniref:MBL fold metallo-hydrolase n=1 Tax=Labrys miyagiensis TaxID=346912 RepID=A0ABQ6CIG1_9HYPH|nr:MBL fold metallo-hydrolase [Labrys miyagiensis]GLS20004.1 MBL fold metallo-hydrolase [Labrys miyagiensis]
MAFAALRFSGTLAHKLAASRPETGVSLYWLGQAGFLVDTGRLRILIDPYLSDSLAQKYRDRGFSHERMMPPPIEIADLPPIDFVACTHFHTDHMDGATLAPIAERFPAVSILVPKASLKVAAEKTGLGPNSFIGVDAGETLVLGEGAEVTAVRAAHEELTRDEAGHHLFLGYGFRLGHVRIFHSGDTIPFEGQLAEIEALKPDIALFPVNGRSEALRSAGIVGNFTLDEAVEVAEACAIPILLAHHFGMFAFNTVAPEIIDARAVAMTGKTRLLRAREGIEYRL